MFAYQRLFAGRCREVQAGTPARGLHCSLETPTARGVRTRFAPLGCATIVLRTASGGLSRFKRALWPAPEKVTASRLQWISN